MSTHFAYSFENFTHHTISWHTTSYDIIWYHTIYIYIKKERKVVYSAYSPKLRCLWCCWFYLRLLQMIWEVSTHSVYSLRTHCTHRVLTYFWYLRRSSLMFRSYAHFYSQKNYTLSRNIMKLFLNNIFR